jgi:NTE family protein
MTTAFVLSGGGSLGAVQVGMLRALADRGEQPDLLVGSSAGALNAAFVAGRAFGTASVDALAATWRGLRRSDVFPFAPARHVLALAGARPSLCSPDGLVRLIASYLTFDRLEDARIPLHVVATDVLSGSDVLLSEGPAAPAVLASASIPAVLPPVSVGGRMLFDGGIANNTPISHAVALGADRVVVLPAGVTCDRAVAPRSALATALHAITLLIEQRLMHDVAAFHDAVDLVVLPPLCPLAISSADFRHADDLVARAHRATTAWLDAGGERQPHPERFLSLHTHHPNPPAEAATP